jgi:hypothetical protein
MHWNDLVSENHEKKNGSGADGEEIDDDPIPENHIIEIKNYAKENGSVADEEDDPIPENDIIEIKPKKDDTKKEKKKKKKKKKSTKEIDPRS